MRRYKIIIILVWLCVPLAAALLVYLDYQRFNIVSTQQREECQGRLRWLGSYFQQSWRQAQAVPQIESLDNIRQWRSDMDDLTRRMYRDSLRLGSSDMNLYPETRREIEQAAIKLDEFNQILNETVDDQAYLFNVNSKLVEMAQEIRELESTTQYYKLIGAEQIYLGLQETLAIREGNYDRQLNGRKQLVQTINQQIDEAAAQAQELDAMLVKAGELIAEDSRLTYSRSLERRLREFNLRRELHRLFTPLGEPPPAQRRQP